MVRKALLIGINYIGTEYELNGCINDAKNLRSFLTDNCLFKNENIKMLSDEDSLNLPNRSNMVNGIKWLVSNNLPGDTLFFLYSGHGGYIRDRNLDESDGRDETIIPLDFETSEQITDDWLFTNMVSKVPKGVNLNCFFDSCHSGTAIDLKYNYKSNCIFKKGKLTENVITYKNDEWSDSFNFSIERTKDVVGNICLFSGCQDKETSADAFINNKGQGAFTFCLLETLKQNLVKMDDGTFRYRNGVLKLRNILKEINGRLDINVYEQNTQLSLSKKENFETMLNF